MAKKQVAVSLRKPPSPEHLDAFVAAGADQPAPAAPPKRAGARAAKPAPSPATAPLDTDVTPVCAAAVAEGPPPASAPQPPESGVQVAAAPSAEAAPSAAAPPVADPTPAEPTPAPVDVGGRPLRAVTVYLPSALAERLTVHCIAQDRDLNNVIGEALEQHLQKRLGAGAWSPGPATTGAGGDDAPPRSGPFRDQDPFRDRDPFRWADPFRSNPRVDRVVQLGRVLVTLWRQRPWAA